MYEKNYKNELLNKPLRKLLKDDAVPTIFAHNSNKQPTKRRSSILREESRAKRILCEEAVSHQEAVYNFEFEYNTKGTQTEVTFEDTLHNQSKKVDFGVQCFLEDFEPEPLMHHFETESDSYQESDESETKNFSEEEYSDIEVHSVLSIPTPPKAAFIVYWTSLLVLLNRCLRST